MRVRPLHDKLIVTRDVPVDKSPGGILLPDKAKEAPLKGKVLAVGPGRFNENGVLNKMDVKEGDRILFGRYAGNEVEIEGEKFIIMSEHDVLAVLD